MKLSKKRRSIFFIKENPSIVPVQLDPSNLVEGHRTKTQGSIPSCQLKMNGAEATFYNGVDQHILHAV